MFIYPILQVLYTHQIIIIHWDSKYKQKEVLTQIIKINLEKNKKLLTIYTIFSIIILVFKIDCINLINAIVA